jgi:dephospho-CoA kinase
MWAVGLTGSIATGKSTVLEMFKALGVPVFSSDEAVHALYRGAAVPIVEGLFPGVSHNGQIDRTALSAKLLGHPEKLAGLEAAIHPLVRSKIATFLEDARKRGEKLAVVDIPLLFEGGFDYGLDRVVVTMVDDATLRHRALARPGMSVEKLDAILARQMPQAEKKARAAYVFDTGQPLGEVRKSVVALVAALRATPKEN